ncbi:hypothetical protein Tco_0922820 [Tanacetum coccineum]|uniref:Uncharacterized protein n=1 Tax=Tanacetum coccineum TaxID=301880 RepID=A0ABQ5D2J1_9ASTR
MALKQLIIDQLNIEVDADMKIINRITTLLRELLVDEDERESRMEEIKKLPPTRLHQYSHLYLVLLNEKDYKKMKILTDMLVKIRALVNQKMDMLKEIIEI